MTTFIRKLAGTGAVLAATTPLFAHIGQHLKLTASDGFPGDLFGHSVALNDHHVVVGAPAQDIMGADSGAVYLFEREGLEFHEHAKLLAFDGNPLDRFGEAVAISHHTIAVGAPQDDDLGTNSGAVYVYVESAGVWTLEAKLLPSDGAAGDEFGTCVDIEEDRIAVGAPGHDLVGFGNDSGAAYIFDRAGTIWTEVKKCVASDPGPRHLFGKSIAINQDPHAHAEHSEGRVILGAPQDSSVVAFGGSAYVFNRVGGVWNQEAKLVDAVASENDRFGSAVDMLDNVAVVGSPGDDELVLDAGAIFVFDETSHAWPQVQHKYGDAGANPSRLMGSSVAMGHGSVVAGAPKEDTLGFVDAGRLYVWDTEEDWDWDVATADDPADGAHLGLSVAISGCWMATGADQDDELGANAGAVYVYPAHMHMDTYCTAGTSASGCQALLGTFGIPCASAPSGFRVFAQTVEGQKAGLFFFGANGQQAAPWGGSTSFQCVVPPVIRTPVLNGNGTVGLCDGGASIDLNAVWWSNPAKNPGGGAIIDAQFWYRDPLNSSGTATSLSDAINIEVCP